MSDFCPENRLSDNAKKSTMKSKLLLNRQNKKFSLSDSD